MTTAEAIIMDIMDAHHGEPCAIRRADLLTQVDRALNHHGQMKLTEQFKDADRVLRDAYVRMNRYCSSAHGLFIPTGKDDIARFEIYLTPKVPVWAVRARIDALKARYPHFYAPRPVQMTLELGRGVGV